MKTGDRLSWVLFLIAGATGLAPSALEAAPRKTLKVAVVLRLNDRFNDSVDALKQGVETAKYLFEKQHPRTRIELKYYPHSESLESVVKAADQVIADGIPAVVGSEMSDEAIALGDKFKEKGIAFITPTASNPLVTEGKPHTFRGCFSDTQVADRLAHYLVDRLQPESVGLVHNISHPYTNYLSSRFLETYFDIMKTKSGLEKSRTILVRKTLGDQKDFEAEIDEFKKHKVTHVVMLNYQTAFTQFVLQAASKGFHPVYLGSDGWGSNENLHRKLVVESPAGERFIGYRNSYWKEDSTSPIATQFRRSHMEKFKKKPDAWNAIAFDSAWVLFLAMERSKDGSHSSEIVQELKKLRDVPLVTTSRFSFGADNSPAKDLFIYTIGKRGIQYEATLR